MKAFRNINGTVTEITVDIDLNGNPILPPDTTVDPRPQLLDGHYLTVVGNSWVQIPIVVQEVTLDDLKREKMEFIKNWADNLLEQPIVYEGIEFDADEKARARISQAIVTYNTTEYLPAAWITRDNTAYNISSFEDLKGLGAAIASAFTERFFTGAALRAQVLEATSEAELNAIELPPMPM